MAERDQKAGGYGDDQGTRVGSPDQGVKGNREHRGPSTQPVSEGLEGSILNESKKEKGKLGAGSEASEGIHEASPQGGGQDDRAGSEPMRGSEHQHVSGYGGEGGKPKTSSDQRP